MWLRVPMLPGTMPSSPCPAQRAHLVRPLRELAEGLEQLRVALGQRLEAGLEGAQRVDQHPAVRMLVAADRYVAAGLIEHLLQPLLVDAVGGERQPRSDHAKADVDAHCCRVDGLEGSDVAPMPRCTSGIAAT